LQPARSPLINRGKLFKQPGPLLIGNVLVPTHLWKVLYSPAQKRAGAYVITNDDTRTYSAVTVSELEKMIGVSLLPGLSQKVRDSGMDLPKPSSQRGKKKKNKAEEEFTLRDFSRSIIDAIKRASQL
jgi:endonuclease G